MSENHFSKTFAEARRRIMDVAESAGATISLRSPDEMKWNPGLD
ncbi:MAG: hypothetical protein OER96_01785 [Gammaproteobacteria bacterium]|nr:hypothetical protein [Gammaproteobacteria bacterium]